MNKNAIRENEFSPAPAGRNGTNIEFPGLGTQNSEYNTSKNFHSSNNNKAVNQNSNTTLKVPTPGDLQKSIDQVYSKKDAPSVDEVITGIKYELNQQIKKDKGMAKEAVLTNLKKDPHYYSKLNMLNINDKDMVKNMNEGRHPNDGPAKLKLSPNIEETKKIFDDMSKAYGKKYVVNSQISDVMKEMWDAKKKRNDWKLKK